MGAASEAEEGTLCEPQCSPWAMLQLWAQQGLGCLPTGGLRDAFGAFTQGVIMPGTPLQTAVGSVTAGWPLAGCAGAAPSLSSLTWDAESLIPFGQTANSLLLFIETIGLG